jgi:hypothetical protein
MPTAFVASNWREHTAWASRSWSSWPKCAPTVHERGRGTTSLHPPTTNSTAQRTRCVPHYAPVTLQKKISGTFRAPTGFSMKRRTKARTQASTSILLGLQSCHKWAMQTFLYYRPSSSAIIRLLETQFESGIFDCNILLTIVTKLLMLLIF